MRWNKTVCFALTINILFSSFAFAGVICNAEDSAKTDVQTLVEKKIGESDIVLFVGSPMAYVKGTKQKINSNNDITPIIDNNKTLVPLKFISESCGATVLWDESTSSIDITLGDKTIGLTIGSQIMLVNGIETILDNPVYETKGSTLVPLRAIVEALGMKVFWDDRGLIIISDQENIVDAITDSLVVDGIVSRFTENITLEDLNVTIEDLAEKNADTYFSNTDNLFRDFAPGVLRPDEGTVELTFKIDKPINEFGNGWDFAFSMLSAKPSNTAGAKNYLSVYVPPLPDKGITFILRNGKESYSLNIPDFTYNAGEKFNLALMWKAGDKVCMYKNGVLLGSLPMGDPIQSDIIPYSYSVQKHNPFNIQQMKISAKALSEQELTTEPNAEFTPGADTSIIASNNLLNKKRYKTPWHEESKYSTLLPAWRIETQCFTEGENVFYPVMSVNYSDSNKDYTVNITAKSTTGNVIMTKSTVISVPNDGQYHINEIMLPELNKRGFYEINTSISLNGKTISEYASAISNLPANDKSIPDGVLSKSYGQHYPVDHETSFLERVNQSITRSDVFKWREVEPVKGEFSWDIADGYVKRSKAANMDILGIIGCPPRWAAKEPSAEEIASAKQMSQMPDRWKPRSIDEWANYIYQTALRYKDDVQYWEIINEVNFHPPYMALTFSGTTEEYLELLKVAYREAKRANPNCKILTSGFAVPHKGVVDVDMPFQLTSAEYAQGYYDIFNVHGYLGPEAFKNCIDNLNVQRPGTEYWMTEEMPFQIQDEKKRVYSTVSTYISFIESGYEKFFHMGTPSMEVFNTFATLSPTKCYQAAGVLQNYMRKCDAYVNKYDGFTSSSSFSLKHYFKRTDGKYLSILGNSPTECDVYISGTIDKVEDIYGNAVNIETAGDLSKVRLKDILYIESSQPFEIKDVQVNSDVNYITNGGFEDNAGDIAVGVDSLKPLNWTFRDTTYDSGGKVCISAKPSSGKYSVSVKSTGAGKVYLFQDVSFANPGSYKVTAKFKKVSGVAALTPYISLYNRDTNKVDEKPLNNIKDSEFSEVSVKFVIPEKTQQNASVIFGILSGQGEVLIDDIKMEAVSADGTSVSEGLLSNSGFEEGTSNWVLRDVTYDPEGAINISAKAETGNSALLVKSSGQGRVYAFQDADIKQTGTYRVTASFRRVAGRTDLKPYIYFYNRDTNKIPEAYVSSLLGYKFVKATLKFEVTEIPIQKIAIGVGINSGAGEVLIDNVTLELIK